MLFSLACLLACAAPILAAVPPSAIYDGGIKSNASIALRIGNGGAGQSGLVEALANKFIQDSVASGHAPFKVAWVTSDTTYSIKYLASSDVDVAITYSPVAEDIAISQHIALSPPYYAFRDHFMLVGPPSNPAKLDGKMSIQLMFSTMYAAGEASVIPSNKLPPVRFLSRWDKSATNLKDVELFASIGQVPFATTVSTWYHHYIAFPIQALTAAITLGEYTITDRGTWLSMPTALTKPARAKVYKVGEDNEDDPLLNPAHLLVGANAMNETLALEFAHWVIDVKHGQKVISGFKKKGKYLYTPAPPLAEQRRLGGQHSPSAPSDCGVQQGSEQKIIRGSRRAARGYD